MNNQKWPASLPANHAMHLTARAGLDLESQFQVDHHQMLVRPVEALAATDGHVIKGARIMSDKITDILIMGLSGLIFGLIVALISKSKRFNKFRTPAMSKGIATGICLGIAIGVAMQNIGAGIAIGVAIGTGIGRRNQKRERLIQSNK